METRFQTSFIPKKALEETKKTSPHGVGIFSLLSYVIFIAAITLAAGTFLYSRYLGGIITKKDASLAKAKDAYEPALIDELSRLNGRIEASKEVLNNHVALSSFFDVLGQSTLKTVRFSSFSYSLGADGKVIISMEGQAESFGSIALQSDFFGKSKYIKNAIFSNLNLDRNGNVTFNLNATVDPSLIAYETVLLRTPADIPQPAAPDVPSVPSASTTPAGGTNPPNNVN